jgi:preprotein translocase subunit SecF
LVVGFMSGTYSTVYIATRILIDWVATKPQSQQGRQATGGGPASEGAIARVPK